MVRTIQEGQWFRPETAFTKLYKSVPFTEKRPRLPAWNWYQRWLWRNQNRNTGPFEKVQMSLDCSIRLLQTDITIWRSSAGQTSIFTCDELNYNKFKICMIIYWFSLVRENSYYWTPAGRLSLIQLIGSTRPKFDVWPNRRSWFN